MDTLFVCNIGISPLALGSIILQPEDTAELLGDLDSEIIGLLQDYLADDLISVTDSDENPITLAELERYTALDTILNTRHREAPGIRTVTWVDGGSPASLPENGSQDRPFRLIQDALDRIGPATAETVGEEHIVFIASPGGEIGVYDENLVVPNGRKITLCALGGLSLGNGTTTGDILWEPATTGSYGIRPTLNIVSISKFYTRLSTSVESSGWCIKGKLEINNEIACDLNLIGPGSIAGPIDTPTSSAEIWMSSTGVLFESTIAAHESFTATIHLLAAQYCRFASDMLLLKLGRLDVCDIVGDVEFGSMSIAVKPVGLYSCSFGSSLIIKSTATLPMDDVTIYNYKKSGGVYLDGTKVELSSSALNATFLGEVVVPSVSGGEPASECQVDIVDFLGQDIAQSVIGRVLAQTAQYGGELAVNTNVTFSDATSGSILASGSGWVTFSTDASGVFVCEVSNSADEVVYFTVTSAVGAATAGVATPNIRPQLDAAAEWS